MAVEEDIKKFDDAIESFRDDYFRSGGDTIAFDDDHARFVIFHVLEQDPNGRRWAEVYREGKKVKRYSPPRLWADLRTPLCKILRQDPIVGKYYAGFAVLFTINQAPTRKHFLSMTVDAPLEAPGLKDAELSRFQFNGPPGTRPFPLTSVCLDAPQENNFSSLPIIFYWKNETIADPEWWGTVPDELESWGHVYGSGTIPRHPITGLSTVPNPESWGFHNELVVPSGNPHFDKEELHRRLALYYSSLPHDPADKRNLEPASLERRLLWTLTYFAYVRENNEAFPLRDFDGPVQETITGRRPAEPFAIVCAPVAYRDVTAALYVPVLRPSSGPEFARLALQVLYLSRALGYPLESLRRAPRSTELGRAQERTDFSHSMANVVDRLVLYLERRLSNEERAKLGWYFFSQLQILLNYVNAYGAPSTRRIADESWPIPWEHISPSGPLAFYRSIAFDLALQRVRRVDDEAVKRLVSELVELPPESADFRAAIDRFVEPMDRVLPEAEALLKSAGIGTILVLILRQAMYHTLVANARLSTAIRTQLIIQAAGAADSPILFCEVHNPSHDVDPADTSPRDVAELRAMAERFSRHSEYQFTTNGPQYDRQKGQWVTLLKVERKT